MVSLDYALKLIPTTKKKKYKSSKTFMFQYFNRKSILANLTLITKLVFLNCSNLALKAP